MDGLGGGGASSSTQFVFKGSGLASRLPSGESSPNSSAAPSAAQPSAVASSSSTSHVMDGPPVLLDCSVHEGSCRGGTALWLHGKRLRPEMTVTFGGAPCRQAAVVSGEVIKLVTPPCMPHNAHRRHQVRLHPLLAPLTSLQPYSHTGLQRWSHQRSTPQPPALTLTATSPTPPRPRACSPARASPWPCRTIAPRRPRLGPNPNANPNPNPNPNPIPNQVLLGLVDRGSGLQCSSSTLVFEFVPDAPAAAPVRPALLQELLQRLLGSLQHAQAAAAAAAAADEEEEPAAAAAAARVVALLRREDEHGYSLEGYTGGLHKMLGSLGWLADRQAAP